MPERPKTITKKWLAVELGYYVETKNGVKGDWRMMNKYIYTSELVEDILGMTYDQFGRIRRFNSVQTKKILDHVFGDDYLIKQNPT